MHSTSSSILKEYLLQRYIIPITEKKTTIDILCVCVYTSVWVCAMHAQ